MFAQRDFWLIGLLVGYLCIGAAQGDEPKNRFRKTIQFTDLKEKGLASVQPDSDIFQHAARNFADVRVVDSWNNRLPLVKWSPTQKTTLPQKGVMNVKDFKTKRNPDGTAEARFRLPLGPEASANQKPGLIRITTTNQNFEAKIQLFGLPTKGTPTFIGEGQISHYQGFLPLEQLDFLVEIPPYPEYLVTIGKPTFRNESELIGVALDLGITPQEETYLDRKPLEIRSVLVGYLGSVTQPEPKWSKVSPKSFKVTQDQENQRTLVEFETSGEPLQTVKLKIGDKQFVRHCLLQVDQSSGGAESWLDVEKRNIHRLDVRNIQSDISLFSLKGNNQQKFRMVIQNSFLPPLEIQGVELEALLPELVFIASPGVSYWVEYGDTKWDKPVEDTDPVSDLMKTGATPLIVALGPEEPWESRPPLFSVAMLTQPWFLGTLLGILFVGFLVAKYRGGGSKPKSKGKPVPV